MSILFYNKKLIINLFMEFVDIEKLSSKEVICHLLRKYYDKGWFSGSGGGISIRENDDCIYIAPSGV